MIARLWKGETSVQHADHYSQYLRETGERDARATPGNQDVLVLRRLTDDRAEFLFLSVWDSLDSIRAFAGDDETLARYYPEDRRYLLRLEERVEHWEIL